MAVDSIWRTLTYRLSRCPSSFGRYRCDLPRGHKGDIHFADVLGGSFGTYQWPDDLADP